VITLRPLVEADLEMTLAWRNRDDVRCYFVHSEVITPEQHAAWYAAYRSRQDDRVWIVAADGVPCGQVSLYDITRARAEFGRMMIGVPTLRGKGVGRAMCLAALDMGRAWGLDFVYLRVLADNQRAIDVYRDCGFEASAGLMRESGKLLVHMGRWL
jgi:diamine N-acetyltransferase